MNGCQKSSILNALKVRQHAFGALRKFLDRKDYLEVQSPILVDCPGTEIFLNYFASTYVDFHGQQHQKYLRSSPELHLKRILSAGAERIYELAPCFRNGGEVSPWHHPEFTMLEWYRVGATYDDFMDETEDLVLDFAAAMKECPGDWASTAVAIKEPFERMTVFEAFEAFCGIELIDQDPDLAKRALSHSKVRLSVHAGDSFEDAYFKLLLERIEPALRDLGAVILYDFPASQSALAQVSGDRAQRFELYLNGVEICNAFVELVDEHSNRQVMELSNQRRVQRGAEPCSLDHRLLDDLKRSPLASCCGNALGVERLMAVVLGLSEITSLLPFNELYCR